MSKEYAQRTFLHHLLDRQRMTQKYFAELMGCDRPNVSLWMSGKRLPQPETMEKMADILQVDRNWLRGHMLGLWLVGQEKAEVLTVIKDHLASHAEGDFMDKWMGINAK
jgi:transcriptional regulator with XRE-family HTH domain